MDRSRPLDAASARQVFGQNLRQLSQKAPSIAALCRELGINRTQFNRYLSGSAFPRPDVLDRITRHFGTDARILTTPLDTLEAENAITKLLANAAPDFAHLTRDFDHSRLPDGLYLVTVPKLVDPDFITTTLIRLHSVAAGAVVVDWSLPEYYARLTMGPAPWHARRARGIVLQHVDGVSFYFSHPSSRVIRTMYFSYGYQGAAHIHTGVVTSTSPAPGGRLPSFPAVLEEVRRTTPEYVAARRRCGSVPRDVAPEAFRHYARTVGF